MFAMLEQLPIRIQNPSTIMGGRFLIANGKDGVEIFHQRQRILFRGKDQHLVGQNIVERVQSGEYPSGIPEWRNRADPACGFLEKNSLGSDRSLRVMQKKAQQIQRADRLTYLFTYLLIIRCCLEVAEKYSVIRHK